MVRRARKTRASFARCRKRFILKFPQIPDSGARKSRFEILRERHILLPIGVCRRTKPFLELGGAGDTFWSDWFARPAPGNTISRRVALAMALFTTYCPTMS